MRELLLGFRLLDLLDIVVVSFFVYYVLLWFKGSRALQLIKGFSFIVVLFILSHILHLYTIQWLMEKLAAIIFLMLIIVFQPELRLALEKLGRQSFISAFIVAKKGQEISFISQIIRAVEMLASKKTGALIVLEGITGLNEYLESGLKLDARISYDLILSVFQKAAPIHDGAMIIQGDRIAGVSCLLPLSESKFIDQRLGTRHRAALGLSEISDAKIIIVSEETGIISLAENGILARYLTRESLEERLLSDFSQDRKQFAQYVTKFFNRKKENQKNKKIKKK